LFTVTQEVKGGRSYQKLGYADINLAEFAGAKHVSHCYLLDGYNSRSRQDNSLLKVTIDMTQLSGDSLFKVLVLFSWLPSISLCFISNLTFSQFLSSPV